MKYINYIKNVLEKQDLLSERAHLTLSRDDSNRHTINS